MHNFLFDEKFLRLCQRCQLTTTGGITYNSGRTSINGLLPRFSRLAAGRRLEGMCESAALLERNREVGHLLSVFLRFLIQVIFRVHFTRIATFRTSFMNVAAAAKNSQIFSSLTSNAGLCMPRSTTLAVHNTVNWRIWRD